MLVVVPPQRGGHNAPRPATAPGPQPGAARTETPRDPSMTKLPPPSTTRYQEKREGVLNAAALLFNQRGVKGATLSDIATSVGLVTNSVTYYYRKKEDLATDWLLRAIDAFNELAALAARESDPQSRLHAFFAQLAQLLIDIEAGTRAPVILFNDIRALPSPHAEQVFAAYTDTFRHVRSLLKGPQTAGLARD